MKIFHSVYMLDIYLVANFLHDWWYSVKNINLPFKVNVIITKTLLIKRNVLQVI